MHLNSSEVVFPTDERQCIKSVSFRVNSLICNSKVVYSCHQATAPMNYASYNSYNLFITQ